MDQRFFIILPASILIFLTQPMGGAVPATLVAHLLAGKNKGDQMDLSVVVQRQSAVSGIFRSDGRAADPVTINFGGSFNRSLPKLLPAPWIPV